MKKVFYKVGIICITLLLISNMSMMNSIAASYNFSFVGPTEGNVGDTLTYTITGEGLAGLVQLSGSNVQLSKDQEWIERNSISITAKILGFPASITATPVELTDNDYETVSVSPKTININQKQSAPPSTGGSTGGESENQGTQNTPSSGETGGTNQTQQIPAEGGGNNQEPVAEAPKSSNNYLSSLSVSQGTLTPAFSREKMEYTIEFPEDFDFSTLENINVSARAEDSRAKVGGTGTINVKVGENVIEINVMAENESVRTYRLTFIKPEIIEQSDLRLSNLIVKTVDGDGKTEEVELDPKFNSETFNYELKVGGEIESLEIDSEVENDKIIVNVEGADKLQNGKNLVKITLLSPTDEEVKSVYQITVNKEDIMLINAENVELNNKKKTKIIMGIVAGIIVVLAIALVVLLIINHKKNKQEQAGSEDDEDYDKFVKKPNEKELQERKQKLFNYDDEDTYVTEDNLKKLGDEYEETAKQIENEEKEKHQEFDKMAGEMESEKYDDKVEIDVDNKEESETENNSTDEQETEEEEIARLKMEEEAREKKLAELEKEIKDKRKKSVNKETEEKEFNKEDFLNDIKKKKH